ncbi:unnamed protein product [Symbiodinium microadriaticum]|nr:unnamed protein product [Symbiodinium microadriaticum]CAE7944190.1 unnamed protein product [Symbiodinium sp. KB8]
MDLTSTAGVSCRVWLPDSVLAAGAKLKEALEGIGSANIEHLRRKHIGAKFSVKGQPSTEPAPWRRLHVVVMCPTAQMLAKAQADVVDLCETACDVAADILGLTDDQVQDAFEKIRVERQESTRIEGPLQFPLPMPALVNTAALDIWQRDESPNPKQASPTLWSPSEADAAPLLAQQGLGTTPKSATPAVMPPRPKVRGIPAAFAGRLPRTVEPMSLPTPTAMMQGLQMAPPTPLPARPPIAMTPLTPVPLIPTPPASAILTPPASELPGGPHMLDAHLEVARLAQAWLERGRKDETGRPKKRARTRLESDPYLLRAHTEDPYLTMLKEAEAEDGMTLPEDSPMPPPNSIVAHKRKAKMQAIPGSGPIKVGQEAQQVDGESKSNSSTSESDSDSEGEESEEPDDDEVEELDDAAVPSASSAAGVEVHLGSEPRLQLYKLGAKCCDVLAHFVGGNENSLPESHRLDIDQRVRLEHCRRHLQWADDLTTVWHFSLSEAREKDAWAALRNYFVSRKRVGLAELPRSVVYIVPPDQEFLSELGLPAAAESLAGSLLGLQVPLYQSEGNPQDRDPEPVPTKPPSEPPTAMQAAPEVAGEPEASVPPAQASQGLPAEPSLELQTEARARQGNVEGMPAEAPSKYLPDQRSDLQAPLDDLVERLEERSRQVVQDGQAGGIPETCDATSQAQIGEKQDAVIEAAGLPEGAGDETPAELAMQAAVVSRTTTDTCSKAEPILDSSEKTEDGEANGSQHPDDSSVGAVPLEEDLSR